MTLRLLDLFCGAGGAAMGYHRAGFDEIVGVDIKPQPRYPFAFVQADALDYLRKHGREFDAIHASPPCQKFSSMRVMKNARPHGDLLNPCRELLAGMGVPYVIENVPGAPMDTEPPDLFGATGGVVLCGTMFGLMTEEYELRRHRLFEASIPLQRRRCRHTRRETIGFYGDHARRCTRINGHHARGTDIVRKDEKLALVRQLMGIDWMEWSEATQAIPPAYTEHIGRQLLSRLARSLASATLSPTALTVAG